jgi:hypothetical protein
MRYQEIITERTLHDPEFNLENVQNFMQFMGGTEIARSGLNNALLLAGLVGDPKLSGLSDHHRLFTQQWEILNDYAPGEDIDKNTRLRLIRILDKAYPANWGIAGYYNAFGVDQYLIAIDEDIERINKVYMDQWQKVNTVDTLVHEALHRGFGILRALIGAGNIAADEDALWILQSDNTMSDGVSGEHALIYSVTDSSNREKFTQGWANNNRRELNRRFGIGSSAFNDRYVDMQNGEQPVEDIAAQVELFCRVEFEKFSQLLRDYLGSRLMNSPRPRSRSQGAPPAARPLAAPDTATTSLELEVGKWIASEINRGRQGAGAEDILSRQLQQLLSGNSTPDRIRTVVQSIIAGELTTDNDIRAAVELLLR